MATQLNTFSILYRCIFSLLVILALLSNSLSASAKDQSTTFTTESFRFASSGLELDGIISRPKSKSANSIIIVIHGYGETKLGQGRDSVKGLIKDNPELMEELEVKIKEAIENQD